MRGLVCRSIQGAAQFINNTAKATPSGYAPQRRMLNVSNPTPAPKIKRPRAVVQPLTGSVTMKNAANTNAPEKTCCSGNGLISPSYSQNGTVTSTTLPSVATGVCQGMIFFQN